MKIVVIGNDNDDFINKILETYPNFQSETRESADIQPHLPVDPCVTHQGKISDHRVLFVNAGALDDDASEIEKDSRLLIDSLFKRIVGGLHWFFLVIRVGTDADDMVRLLHTFKRVFGEDAMRYTMIVFSNSIRISRYGKDLSSYVSDLPDNVQKLMRSIDKDFFWAFDKLDSAEAFNVGITRLTQDVDARAQKRRNKRCFKMEMMPSPTGSDDASLIDTRARRGRSTFYYIAVPFQRARGRCTIA